MVFGKVRAGLIFTTFAVALLVLGLSADVAFGQDGGSDDVQYSAVCQNILGALDITQTQDGTAVVIADASGGGGTTTGGAGGSAEAVAEIAQAQGVSIAQVNECLNAAERPGGDDTGGSTTSGGDSVLVVSAAADQYKADVIVATIPDKVLPATGGPPLLGLAILSLALIGVGTSVLRAAIRRDR